jgi:hypothetical protein
MPSSWRDRDQGSKVGTILLLSISQHPQSFPIGSAKFEKRAPIQPRSGDVQRRRGRIYDVTINGKDAGVVAQADAGAHRLISAAVVVIVVVAEVRPPANLGQHRRPAKASGSLTVSGCFVFFVTMILPAVSSCRISLASTSPASMASIRPT